MPQRIFLGHLQGFKHCNIVSSRSRFVLLDDKNNNQEMLLYILNIDIAYRY